MRITIGIVCLFIVQLLLPQSASAQQIRQTIRDYCADKPFRYSPCDPWTRSRIFNLHTGHGGWFYNCDGEEDKRNSPYICWKTHYEKVIPPPRGMLTDIAKVKQRIRDGAGACCQPGCKCIHCVRNKHRIQAKRCASCQVGADSYPIEVSNVYETAIAHPPANESIEIESNHINLRTAATAEPHLIPETEKSVPRYGLIQREPSASISNAPQNAGAANKSRLAKAIDEFLGKKMDR